MTAFSPRKRLRLEKVRKRKRPTNPALISTNQLRRSWTFSSSSSSSSSPPPSPNSLTAPLRRRFECRRQSWTHLFPFFSPILRCSFQILPPKQRPGHRFPKRLCCRWKYRKPAIKASPPNPTQNRTHRHETYPSLFVFRRKHRYVTKRWSPTNYSWEWFNELVLLFAGWSLTIYVWVYVFVCVYVCNHSTSIT